MSQVIPDAEQDHRAIELLAFAHPAPPEADRRHTPNFVTQVFLTIPDLDCSHQDGIGDLEACCDAMRT
jgi:hypothetical protein